MHIYNVYWLLAPPTCLCLSPLSLLCILMPNFCLFIWWCTECSQGHLGDHGIGANHWNLVCSRLEHNWRQWFPIPHKLSAVNISAVMDKDLQAPPSSMIDSRHACANPMLLHTVSLVRVWGCRLSYACMMAFLIFICFSRRHLIFVLVTSYIGHSFILLMNTIALHIIYQSLFIPLSIEGHVCYEKSWEVVNKAINCFECRVFRFLTNLIFISLVQLQWRLLGCMLNICMIL